jgi:putative ABC transport system substrate-binding protein
LALVHGVGVSGYEQRHANNSKLHHHTYPRTLAIASSQCNRRSRGSAPTPKRLLYRYFVAEGGLISSDFIDQFRRAASYVDRILKGEKPADLPVRAPAKYELAINLKTAKAIGLDVPASVLARADAVIE